MRLPEDKKDNKWHGRGKCCGFGLAALRVCVPTVKLEEVFKIRHEGVAVGLRGVAGTRDKFQRTFFVMSAREKIRRLVDRCNTCLAKERSIQAKRGPHVPSTVGNVGEKVFIDLASMSETENESLFTIFRLKFYEI